MNSFVAAVGDPQNIVSISKFKFDSLHKYMSPIYAEMNLHCRDSAEHKRATCDTIFPQFFRRMREYREVAIEELAQKSGLAVVELRAFERGEKKHDRAIPPAYVRLLGGQREMECFVQQVHQFHNPSVKESKIDAAMAALRQFGVMIPGVDYKNLHREMGKVLPILQENS